MEAVTASAVDRAAQDRERSELLAIEPRNAVTAWDETGVMLYALGVGAGAADPCQEVAFTTENSDGVSLQVIPTFGVTLVEGGPATLAEVGVRGEDLLLVDESLSFHMPIPTSGTAATRTRVVDVHEHPRGLLVSVESVVKLDGTPLFDICSTTLIRRAGRGSTGASRPARNGTRLEPQMCVPLSIAPNQGLIYRLSAGRNPLHSDPQVARSMGTTVPLLHGRCVLGFAARAIISRMCGDDASRLRSIAASFSAPVFPGDGLEMRLRSDAGAGSFEIIRPSDGRRVVKGGRFVWDT